MPISNIYIYNDLTDHVDHIETDPSLENHDKEISEDRIPAPSIESMDGHSQPAGFENQHEHVPQTSDAGASSGEDAKDDLVESAHQD